MILVTGGTGFIGQALVRHLVAERRTVRILLRPSRASAKLPPGVPVEVAISNVNDERSLRGALMGVDTIFHLAGARWHGAPEALQEVEVEGAQTLMRTAKEAGVGRIIYASHLGADRASAYPVLKAKGIAEEHIRNSGLEYTILRTALIFGPHDHFTTEIAQLFYAFPFVFPTPGQGDALVQPLWVEDLVTCLAWSLDRADTINQTFELGGPEYVTIDDAVVEVMDAIGIARTLMSVRPSYMRIAGLFLEYLFPRLPVSVYWLDYLASNRTCPLDSVPRSFGLMPARFVKNLGYLSESNWRRELWRTLLRRRR